MSVLRSRRGPRGRGPGRRSLALALVILSASLGACGDSRGAREARPAAPSSAWRIVDDFGDTLVEGATTARRIVSLNPTTTEIIFALGGGSRIVGRTHWDAHPDSARFVPDLGDGIRPNVEAVLGARPDLVLLYASAENRDAARQLHEANVRTLTLRIDRVAQFGTATLALGQVLGDTATARIVVDSVTRTLARIRRETAPLTRPRVFWKAWDAPLMAIGGGSFMTEMLDIAGAENIYADLHEPSPQVSLEDVIRRDPDLVIAGANSERTFRASGAWRGLRAVRENRIVVVDTSLVAFPAVRLGQATELLARTLHPELR